MQKFLLTALVATFAGAAAPALAACQGERLFHCAIGTKELEVCQTGSAVSYSFGPAGRPEMQIATAIGDLDYQPWSGVGRAISETVSFHNAGISYQVWSSFDRLDEQAEVEGGVNVIKGDTTVATLSCRQGSTRAGLDLLYTAKEAAGQCWSFEAQAWTQAPCP